MTMINRPRLKLKSFQSIDPAEVFRPIPKPKPQPPVLTPVSEKTEEVPPLEPPVKLGYQPQALWVQIPTSKQYLRIVVDNRVNIGKRIYRIEMYDKDRKERIAIFRRQTEAHRR